MPRTEALKNAQYKYRTTNWEKYKQYMRERYLRIKNNPEKYEELKNKNKEKYEKLKKNLVVQN